MLLFGALYSGILQRSDMCVSRTALRISNTISQHPVHNDVPPQSCRHWEQRGWAHDQVTAEWRILPIQGWVGRRPKKVGVPPPTACLTASGAASKVTCLLLHPWVSRRKGKFPEGAGHTRPVRGDDRWNCGGGGVVQVQGTGVQPEAPTLLQTPPGLHRSGAIMIPLQRFATARGQAAWVPGSGGLAADRAEKPRPLEAQQKFLWRIVR